VSLKRHVEVATRLMLKRPRGWKSVLFNTAMLRARRTGPLMAPAHVSIEPTNACNARCPVCETGKNDMHRKSGFLDPDLYYEFIDDVAPTTNTLLFYFMGEPFMHEHAYDMIRYARDKGLYVETCSNGDFIDAKGVVYSDVNKISIQLGGLDEDTHQRYRVRSSFTKAERNLRALVAERNKHPESNVQIEVGLIVMRHNEHQVEDFKAWAKEMGADVANIIDPCARNMLEAMAYLPKDRKYWFYDEEAFERGILKPKVVMDNDCTWIWNSTQLNWNGDVVPCCRDPNGKHVFGNAFESGLAKVFNGERARDFRHRILTDQGNVDICKLCSGYGIPHLGRPKVANFEVERHSIAYPGQAAE
jgi:MoaA/NifB/PqqE/SkfB family radical SAM enzyme